MNSIINQLLLDIENATKSWGDVIVHKQNNTNLSVELNEQSLIFVDLHEGMPVMLSQQIMDNDGVTFSVDISIFSGQNRRIDFVNSV
jgi:protease II